MVAEYGGKHVPGSEVFGDKKFTSRTLGRPGQGFYYRKMNRENNAKRVRREKNGSAVLGAGIMCEMKIFAKCIGPIRV